METHSRCPECGHEVHPPEGAVLEEVFECDACAVELQVVNLQPLSLTVYEEAEK